MPTGQIESLARILRSVKSVAMEKELEEELLKLLPRFFDLLKTPQDLTQYLRVGSQIKKLLGLVRSGRSGGLLTATSCLRLERDLLRLDLLVLSTRPKAGDDANIMRAKGVDKRQEIIDFIKGRGEVVTQEIFKRFSDVSRRGLKRHLGKLVESGVIARRVISGKLTSYVVNQV